MNKIELLSPAGSKEAFLAAIAAGADAIYFGTSQFNARERAENIKLEDLPEPAENYFIVDIKVKQRYINPLVKTVCGSKRISEINKEAEKIIQDFLTFQDTKYGCVKLIY